MPQLNLRHNPHHYCSNFTSIRISNALIKHKHRTYLNVMLPNLNEDTYCLIPLYYYKKNSLLIPKKLLENQTYGQIVKKPGLVKNNIADYLLNTRNIQNSIFSE